MTNTIEYGELIYSDLQAISRTDMLTATFNSNGWMKLAAKIQQTPITVTEFRQACASYPIVFTQKNPAIPIALMSLNLGKNPFVKKNQWQKGHYAPMSLRRYPFLLDTKDDQNILAIDQAIFEETGYSSRLFNDNGENSATLDSAIELCQNYDLQMKNTVLLCQQIEEMGLFTEKQLTIKDKEGNEKTTGLFRMIDSAKYQQLEPAAILALHKTQALWLIHTHMISLDRVRNIASMSA